MTDERERLREALHDCEPIYEGEAGHPPVISYKVPEWLALRIDAALSHDRPSGSVSDLGEAIDAVADALNGWDLGEPPRPDTHRHWSKIVAALPGSSDPEAGGLDVERLAQAASDHQLEWQGVTHRGCSAHDWSLQPHQLDDPSGAFTKHLASVFATLTEAKPETPA